MVDTSALIARNKYGATYVANYEEFRQKILEKTVVPYQVEFQPPPRSKKKICWLECPYCYGLSATDNGERMPRERALEIMREIAEGGVRKVVFAGYATDPLHCPYIDDLLEIAIERGMVFGFNTKALRVSPRFVKLLERTNVAPTSYLSISVDAGSNEAYNATHAVKGAAANYNRVLHNVKLLSRARSSSGVEIDLTASYLINAYNCDPDEVARFIDDFQAAGCNLLRFTFPQPPRGLVTQTGTVPTFEERAEYRTKLCELISSRSGESCPVLFVDADSEHELFGRERTLPCFARFIFPTIGFDGWLYHCSQSSAPNFRGMALGNLAERGFWDLYYDYDPNQLSGQICLSSRMMSANGCRCDRKEHIVNSGCCGSGVFDDILIPDPCSDELS